MLSSALRQASTLADILIMQLEEITAHIDPEEGWIDIFLNIVESIDSKESVLLTCKGLYKGAVVGLQIDIRKGMDAGLLPTDEINQSAFYRDGIRIISIGLESDYLIKAISELYQFPTDKPFLKQIDDAMTFSLNSIGVDLTKKQTYNFKMFFHEDSEDLNCEIYCNIDLENNIVELHEKDVEYRENLIKTFSNSLK
jgi:hypothetical protein